MAWTVESDFAIESCPLCAELPDEARADLTKGESLPAAAARLEPIRPQRVVVGSGAFSRCPSCATHYRRDDCYESELFGPGQEDAKLSRLAPDEALEGLGKVAPDEQERLRRSYPLMIARRRSAADRGGGRRPAQRWSPRG